MIMVVALQNSFMKISYPLRDSTAHDSSAQSIEMAACSSRSTTFTMYTINPTQFDSSPTLKFTSSRSWKSPAIVARDRWTRILRSRDHICPNSPFLTRIFDLIDHRRCMRRAKEHLMRRKQASTQQDCICRTRHAATADCTKDTLAPFHDHIFATNHASVLSLPTIFTPSWRSEKDFEAPWPSIAEMQHEGDERIATDKEHRRFLPVPRFPCGLRIDLSFGQIDFLPQYDLDSVHRIPEAGDDLAVPHHVVEVEFTDKEAATLLGTSLLRELNPSGMFGASKDTESDHTHIEEWTWYGKRDRLSHCKM